MKVNPGKPNHKNKAGKELPYKSAESVVGGPICNDPIAGLNPPKPVKGGKVLPPVKK